MTSSPTSTTAMRRNAGASSRRSTPKSSVAYVRYASVYRNFREAKDFENFVERLGGEND